MLRYMRMNVALERAANRVGGYLHRGRDRLDARWRSFAGRGHGGAWDAAGDRFASLRRSTLLVAAMVTTGSSGGVLNPTAHLSLRWTANKSSIIALVMVSGQVPQYGYVSGFVL